MKVALWYTCSADIIELPDVPRIDLNVTYQRFDKWLFDKRNRHPYWIYENGRRLGVAKHPEAFVDWLNKTVYLDPKAKATIVARDVESWDGCIPVLQY